MSEQEREPWMRGTHAELDPLRRGVVHALEQAGEDASRWLSDLRGELWFQRPAGLPSIAFHLRHMVRSLDRLLTYAEGRMLDEAQLAALATEHDPGDAAQVQMEFERGMQWALERVRRFQPGSYAEARGIGRKQLPTTVGGLLVHCAEHTQRHAGQMVTTAKLLRKEAEPAEAAGSLAEMERPG